jgi:NADPH:quinone reductase and related Zn-dependent oxidoreductases
MKPAHAGAEGFSLVLGGPLYQLLIKSRLAKPPLQLLHRRMLVIPALAWLPLLFLSLIEGRAVGGVSVPFLLDIEAYARFLVALPILIFAELVVHKRLQAIVQHGYGSTDVLRHQDVDPSTPGRCEVRARMHAASIDQEDWFVTTGRPQLRRVRALIGERGDLRLFGEVGELPNLFPGEHRGLLGCLERDGLLLEGETVDVGVEHTVGLDRHPAQCTRT